MEKLNGTATYRANTLLLRLENSEKLNGAAIYRFPPVLRRGTFSFGHRYLYINYKYVTHATLTFNS